MVPLLMTLVTPNSDFKVMSLFDAEYIETVET